MIERIEQLRAQAESEIAAATTAEALEELRVRHLGRRAELPQMLRGVRELPPAERGSVGKAANEVIVHLAKSKKDPKAQAGARALAASPYLSSAWRTRSEALLRHGSPV